MIEYSGTPWSLCKRGRRRHALRQVVLLAPTVPSKIVFPMEDVVARVAEVMTLLPGDVIATGTPAGVGPLQAGDRVEIRIDGVGTLKNPVVKL